MTLTLAIIAVLSLVQSVAGVGLLVFGTPTLLLLGMPFANTLAILLPASLMISLLQVRASGLPDAPFRRRFTMYCLLPMCVALALTLVLQSRARLDLLVTLLLVAFVLVRVSPNLARRASLVAHRHERPWLAGMGLVHGASNLGGALLLVFATSRHEAKADVRRLISFCYFCFAASQLLVLGVMTPSVFGWQQLISATVAAVVFTTLGNRTFALLSTPAFNAVLTAVAAAYAALTGLRSAGMF